MPLLVHIFGLVSRCAHQYACNSGSPCLLAKQWAVTTAVKWSRLSWPHVLSAGISQLGDRTYDAYGNATITYTATPAADPVAFQALCDKALTNLTNHKASFNSTVQKYLIVQRLGNLRDTGKFAVRYNTANALKAFLTNNYPELVSLIYTQPKGADPYVPSAATLTALMNLYVESDTYLLTGAPAHLALYRRRLNLVSTSSSTVSSVEVFCNL